MDGWVFLTASSVWYRRMSGTILQQRNRHTPWIWNVGQGMALYFVFCFFSLFLFLLLFFFDAISSFSTEDLEGLDGMSFMDAPRPGSSLAEDREGSML